MCNGFTVKYPSAMLLKILCSFLLLKIHAKWTNSWYLSIQATFFRNMMWEKNAGCCVHRCTQPAEGEEWGKWRMLLAHPTDLYWTADLFLGEIKKNRKDNMHSFPSKV